MKKISALILSAVMLLSTVSVRAEEQEMSQIRSFLGISGRLNTNEEVKNETKDEN